MTTRRALLMAFLAATTCAGAAPLPYDETANTTVEIERALAATAGTSRDVLLIFGANWCEDCRALDAALKDAKNAALIATEFQVVKIDVGRFDRNLDVSARYGNPIRKGIPAAVILSPSGQVLFATRAGELADARTMSETGVHDFFRNAAFSARTKK